MYLALRYYYEVAASNQIGSSIRNQYLHDQSWILGIESCMHANHSNINQLHIYNLFFLLTSKSKILDSGVTNYFSLLIMLNDIGMLYISIIAILPNNKYLQKPKLFVNSISKPNSPFQIKL